MRICSVPGTGLRTVVNPAIMIIVILRMSLDLDNCYFSILHEIRRELSYLYQTCLKGVLAIKAFLQDKFPQFSPFNLIFYCIESWTHHCLPLWVTKMGFEGLTVKKTDKSRHFI